jgi:hypothetical protein
MSGEIGCTMSRSGRLSRSETGGIGAFHGLVCGQAAR